MLLTLRRSVFVIGTDCELPPEFVSLVRLLLQNKTDWDKTKSKAKLPKPTMDATVAAIATDVLQNRLKEYPTSIEVSTSFPSRVNKINLQLITGRRKASRGSVSAQPQSEDGYNGPPWREAHSG